MGSYRVDRRMGDLTYLLDLGHGTTTRRHRNALVRYTPDATVAVVVCAQEDQAAEDGASIEHQDEKDKEGDAEVSGKISGLEELSGEKREQLYHLILRYKQIFGTRAGLAKLPEHHIGVGRASPIAARPYRVAAKHSDKLEQHIQQLLENKIIERSTCITMSIYRSHCTKEGWRSSPLCGFPTSEPVDPKRPLSSTDHRWTVASSRQI